MRDALIIIAGFVAFIPWWVLGVRLLDDPWDPEAKRIEARLKAL